MPRFLLLTKEYSEHPTSGGQQRSLAIAQTLSRFGDVVVVEPGGTLRREGGVVLGVSPTPVPRMSMPRLVWNYRCISGSRAGGTRLLMHLARALQQDYDLAVVDHTCLGGLLDIVANHSRYQILSMHNVESELMMQRSHDARLWERALMRIDSLLLARIEGQAILDHTCVMVTSERDADKLGVSPLLCPNGVPQDSVGAPDDPAPDRSVLFAGALDWAPNVEGLQWFVWRVWSRLRKEFPDARLTIAGRNPTKLVRGFSQYQGVEVVGNPREMRQLFQTHALGVVPLMTGGGSRIKILEYLANGMDVVSTEVGASGLEDIPVELVERCSPTLMYEAMKVRMGAPRDNRKAATSFVLDHYTWDKTMTNLVDTLERVVRSQI